jgi:RNA polymerase sigma factor (sigma-70 family)
MPSPFDIATSELLIARLRRADSSAQSSVFRQFERVVYTLCLRMLGKAPAALDAMQDSFIQAFSQIAQFRASAPFGMWLRVIVVNRCLRELRDSKDHRDLDALDPGLEDGLEHEPGQSTWDWSSVALNNRIDLERALASLSARARTVLWLYHVEGYQHAEIAEVFGATVSFSKSQLARALAQLRHILEPDSCLMIETR